MDGKAGGVVVPQPPAIDVCDFQAFLIWTFASGKGTVEVDLAQATFKMAPFAMG